MHTIIIFVMTLCIAQGYDKDDYGRPPSLSRLGTGTVQTVTDRMS